MLLLVGRFYTTKPRSYTSTLERFLLRAFSTFKSMVPLKMIMIYYVCHFMAVVLVSQAMRLALPLTS